MGEGRREREREGAGRALVALKETEKGCHRRWGSRVLQESVPLLKQLLIWQILTEATILELWSVDEYSQCPREYSTKKETGNFQQIVAFCVVTSIPYLPGLQLELWGWLPAILMGLLSGQQETHPQKSGLYILHDNSLRGWTHKLVTVSTTMG